MKRVFFISFFLFFLVLGLVAQNKVQWSTEYPGVPYITTHKEYKCPFEVINGDTVPLFFIRDVYIFPNRFRNKRSEKFFWRTVRDVKKVLPYAHLIAHEIEQTNSVLAKLPNEKAKRAYVRQYSNGLLKKYSPAMKGLTARQGQLLMKLVDRECDQTSYEVIKLYKGAFVANFWQGIARLFGNSLKEDYDGKDKDKIIERVIILVENGQL